MHGFKRAFNYSNSNSWQPENSYSILCNDGKETDKEEEIKIGNECDKRADTYSTK